MSRILFSRHTVFFNFKIPVVTRGLDEGGFLIR
jgi:hypothetical protein